MPTKVKNEVLKVDDETSILMIESHLTGNITILFDTKLDVFVLANSWCWDARHQRAYTWVNNKRVDMHRMLAERAMFPKRIGSVSIHPSVQNDLRVKNMLIRVID